MTRPVSERKAYAMEWTLGRLNNRCNEVLIGDTVVIRARILARNLKLFHYMMFMVNETRGVLSSLFECVHAHADLRTRRTAPFPAYVAARIDALIDEHRALNWTAPVSGSLSVKVASGA